MKVTTLEGKVENGQIKLPENIHLPEKRTVYVIIPDMEEIPATYIGSPHLLHPEQATDFRKEVIEES